MKINIKHPERVFNKHIYDILYNYDSPTELHYGGGSSGKSHGVVQKVVLKALQPWDVPRRVLWMRKVGRTIKDSIFEDVIRCLSSFKILPYCKVNMSDYRITLPNGAVFLFKGADDIEKVKSIKAVSDIVMEEATEFNQEDYMQLTIRLREPIYKKRQLFMMFNPVSKANWVYKFFFEQKQEDVVIYHTTYKDNKFLDEATKKNLELLIDRDPVYYKIYALGEFATLDKLVFPKKTIKRLREDQLIELPKSFGLDFGFENDPSAFMKIAVDMKNKRLYIMEEFVRKHFMNDEIARAIHDLGYAKEIIFADQEAKSIAELRRDGIDRIRKAKKGPDSIIQGVTYLKQFDIIIDDRCVKTIEEFENYTWQKDKKTGEYINKPIDSFNHCIDAIRYAMEPFNGQGPGHVKTFKL
ncbi:TPA: PBSX family phage terminase large subunit [Enterococcus faecium]